MRNSIKEIRIKIIKVSVPTYWYANKINEEYDVYDEGNPINYSVKEDYDKGFEGAPVALRMILKEDCEILNMDANSLRAENYILKEKLKIARKMLKKLKKADCVLWSEDGQTAVNLRFEIKDTLNATSDTIK